MGKHMRNFICVIALAILAGCSNPNSFSQRSEVDFATQGVVAVQIYGNGNGGWQSYKSSHMMQVIIRKVDSSFYGQTSANDEEFEVFRLPAGDYYFATAKANDMLIMLSFPSEAYDEKEALPFKPFTVKAGEAVYLGQIVMDGVEYEQQITGESINISYAYSNEYESDKQTIMAMINAKYPTFTGDLTNNVLEQLQ